MDRTGYAPAIADEFDGAILDERLWIPHYLPQWSSHVASAARYSLANSVLTLRIDADQPPWYPEADGTTRVSSLQTGVFAGPVGSATGQHRFRDGLVVRERVDNRALYTPTYGLFEARARAPDDARCMVALWMIGYEDAPERSAEICIFEIFGRDVSNDHAGVGMGVHPFGDATIRDDFTRVDVAIDVRAFHTYAAEWTPQRVSFYVDERRMKTVDQSPAYPMQFMLGIYEFGDPLPRGTYPKELAVDYFRAHGRRSDLLPGVGDRRAQP